MTITDSSDDDGDGDDAARGSYGCVPAGWLWVCVSPIWSQPPPLSACYPGPPTSNPLFHLTLCQPCCHINGSKAAQGRPLQAAYGGPSGCAPHGEVSGRAPSQAPPHFPSPSTPLKASQNGSHCCCIQNPKTQSIFGLCLGEALFCEEFCG